MIPLAVVAGESARDISMLLPTETVQSFAPLFARLETAKSEGRLGIKSFGISMTTLEDVFLKIANDEIETNSKDAAELTINPEVTREERPSLSKAEVELSNSQKNVQTTGEFVSKHKPAHFGQQFKILFKKRVTSNIILAYV